jgi:hypothetical protein
MCSLTHALIQPTSQVEHPPSPEILVPASVPKPALPSASELGGHITPEWMLHSNLRLLCGNHFIIRQLKGKVSKNKAFTGYRARTIRKQATKSKNGVIRSIL